MLSDSDHWAYSPRKATCHIASLWFVQGDCGSGLGASALTPDSCICGLSGFCCHQQALLGSAGRSVQRLFRLKASSSYGLSGFILVCFRVSWASKTGRKKKISDMGTSNALLYPSKFCSNCIKHLDLEIQPVSSGDQLLAVFE